MKYVLLTVVLVCQGITGFGQWSEFTIHPNGLIYSDSTINRLKFVVDSLHIKYKNCDLNKSYYSVPQTWGHYILLDTGDVVGALKDIQANMSYSTFLKKYPLAQADSNTLITRRVKSDERSSWIEYRNQTAADFGDQTLTIKHDSADFIDPNGSYTNGKKDKWAYNYNKGSDYSKAKIEAFYFDKPFSSTVLPERYARMVLYSDCMIDTLTDTYLETAQYDREILEKEYGPKYLAFVQYLIKKIDYPSKDMLLFREDSVKEAYIKDRLSMQPEFKDLLTAAVEETLQGKYITNDWFESCVARYYSGKAALTMIRGRIVMGFCSRDQAPRRHTLQIALLAAETADWQVFLRTHLNIMNDNIHRAVDASYAKKYRDTYIKELEGLDINVVELMMAISLRIDNAASNHYFGDIERLGRALAESKDRDKLEQKMISFILDNALDDYNRVIMHYLFLNYIYYLDKKEDRLAGLQKLETAEKELPRNLSSKLVIVYREYIEKGAEANR